MELPLIVTYFAILLVPSLLNSFLTLSISKRTIFILKILAIAILPKEHREDAKKFI